MVDLAKTRARDLMSRDLQTLEQDSTVTKAVETLEEYHISGAPVVNDAGECVGVFSITDFLKRRREVEAGEAPRAGGYFSTAGAAEEEESFSVEDYDPEVLGEDTVGEWMTAQVKSVAPDAPITEVCRSMVAERIHRVLVMENRKLVGIITSFDVMRLLAAGVPGGPSHPAPSGKPPPAQRKPPVTR